MQLTMCFAIIAATIFFLRDVEQQAIFEETFLEPLSGSAKWHYAEDVLEENNLFAALCRASGESRHG